MLEIKRILCPIDFSEFSIRAYHHALSVAEHYGARVVALHVVELWRYPYADYAASAGDYDNFCRALCDGGREQLQEFVKKHSHGEIHPELVVQQGAAPDLILAFAEARKVDLIVMGTHGRRGFDRWMLGTTTDRVMRRTSCPVLGVCKPRQPALPADAPAENAANDDRRDAHHLTRILFCTDFSENSERALSYAISAATEYDAELTLLNVLEKCPSPDKMEEFIATTAKQLDKLVSAEGHKTVKIKVAVRVGEPYQQIVQVALESQIDMVVMAVHGRGSLDLAVFGSTTYRVMQLGPCPVLAVHV